MFTFFALLDLNCQLEDTGVSKYFFFFFKLGFSPCKADQPLQVMALQEKEAQSTKRLKHKGNLIEKKLQLTGVC